MAGYSFIVIKQKQCELSKDRRTRNAFLWQLAAFTLTEILGNSLHYTIFDNFNSNNSTWARYHLHQ